MRSDGRHGLTQPLTTRPGYGEDGPALPRGSTGESKLPSGPPADRGIPLNEGIPGTKTFVKPVDDIRETNKGEPGSIHRVDGPDLAKPQDDLGDERDHSGFKPTYAPPGGRPTDDMSITRYPYRDGIPNRHNASAEFVAGLYVLATSPEIVLPAGGSFETRTAARLDDILAGLNPKVVERSQRQCTATTKRSDIPNLSWIFSVDCGNGAKVVRMKATRKGNVVKLGLMDLTLSCSCPAWRWLGSEHHSKREDYLAGKPRGTAATPLIRDPAGINRVCKHVAATLSIARGWTIPLASRRPKKTAAAVFKRACDMCLAVKVVESGIQGMVLPGTNPPIRMRAMGEVEFSPAVYQVRQETGPWPTRWETTDDLAGLLLRVVDHTVGSTTGK